MRQFIAYVRRFANESDSTLKELHFWAKGFEKEVLERMLIKRI